jgi:hypothetical protein
LGLGARRARRSPGCGGEVQGRQSKGSALGRSLEGVGRCARKAGQLQRGAREVRAGTQICAELEATQRSVRGVDEAEDSIGVLRIRCSQRSAEGHTRCYSPKPTNERRTVQFGQIRSSAAFKSLQRSCRSPIAVNSTTEGLILSIRPGRDDCGQRVMNGLSIIGAYPSAMPSCSLR